MARITQKEREEASGYIKQTIKEKIEEVEVRYGPELERLREEAAEQIEDEYQIQHRLDMIMDHKLEVERLEKELCQLLECSRPYQASEYRDKLVEARAQALAFHTDVGTELRTLRNRLSKVGRDVFLATTHESLAAMVRAAMEG